MRLRSNNRELYRGSDTQVWKAVKDRLIMMGLATAVLPLAIFSVPWAHNAFESTLDLHSWVHLSVETTLNLAWVLLAVGTIVRWAAPGGKRRRLPGLVTLFFVLALLFPVISATDDLAQMALIADTSTAESISITVKTIKKPASPAGLLATPAATAAQLISPLILTHQSVYEPAVSASLAMPGDATGNHSPPSC